EAHTRAYKELTSSKRSPGTHSKKLRPYSYIIFFSFHVNCMLRKTCLVDLISEGYFHMDLNTRLAQEFQCIFLYQLAYTGKYEITGLLRPVVGSLYFNDQYQYLFSFVIATRKMNEKNLILIQNYCSTIFLNCKKHISTSGDTTGAYLEYAVSLASTNCGVINEYFLIHH
ncbi:hypothetical protein L9F63_001724, partial [Diploptera punctata]